MPRSNVGGAVCHMKSRTPTKMTGPRGQEYIVEVGKIWKNASQNCGINNLPKIQASRPRQSSFKHLWIRIQPPKRINSCWPPVAPWWAAQPLGQAELPTFMPSEAIKKQVSTCKPCSMTSLNEIWEMSDIFPQNKPSIMEMKWDEMG